MVRYLTAALMPLLCSAFASAQSAGDTPAGFVIVLGGIGGMDPLGFCAEYSLPRAGVKHRVSEYVWTHGWGRWLADLQDHDFLERKADELADHIRRIKAGHPQRPIFIVAKSGGTGLAVLAAERLPANTLERIILLSSALSPAYDLRRALQTSRLGIVSFHSAYDQAILNWGTRNFGTIDRVYGPSAGLHGFVLPANIDTDGVALYQKLVQVPWNPRMLWQFHNGMHAGTSFPPFLTQEVAPLLR